MGKLLLLVFGWGRVNFTIFIVYCRLGIANFDKMKLECGSRGEIFERLGHEHTEFIINAIFMDGTVPTVL